ncbi:MAG TPA: hypothetical protein VF980_07230 [Thermoanaerobaculia bacterium]
MRIQQTDKILKDARFARKQQTAEDERGGGLMAFSRVWIIAAVAVAAVLGGLFAWFSRDSWK